MKTGIALILIHLFFGNSLTFGQDKSFIIFPDANSRLTYFSVHNIREAQNLSKGKGCQVGILDHSFGMKNHPELYSGGKSFVADSEELLYTKEHHGYWMALTLRSVAPEAAIYALNTVSFINRNSHAESVAKAVDWAIAQKIDILTFSQGAIEGESKKIFTEALDRAHNAGIITVFINTGHPGNITPTGLWSGKVDGREADINIYHYDYSVIPVKEYFKLKNGEKTWWNRPFLSVSSTSPVLGGVVALMKALNPELTSDQCKKILIETSHPMDFEGRHAPRVLDAYEAVKQVNKN